MTDIGRKKIVRCDHCGVLFESFQKPNQKTWYHDGIRIDGKYYCRRGGCIKDRIDKHEQDGNYQTFKDSSKPITYKFLHNLSRETLIEGILLREEMYNKWSNEKEDLEKKSLVIDYLKREIEKLKEEKEKILNENKKGIYIKNLITQVKNLKYKCEKRYEMIRFLKLKIKKTEKGRTKK